MLFSTYADMINKGKVSEEDNKKMSTELEKKVFSLQIQEFPKLRNERYIIFKKEMSLHKGGVLVSGRDNSDITFLFPEPLDRKTADAAYNGISKILQDFRFQKVTFKYATDSFFYEIKSKKDSDIVIINDMILPY